MNKIMNKIFKITSIVLSCIMLILAISLPFTVNSFTNTAFFRDPFGSNEVISNIDNLELNLTSVIYVKNDAGVWEEYQRIHGEENRIWVDIEDIPQTLIDAFIAIEDERFYSHNGVDWKRTAHAVINKLFKLSDSSFGGSTITQQLIKNITSDKHKTSSRKLREIVRALSVESKLSKTEIMEAYLNTISLGNGICGVEVAANYYFNKSVSELSISECATIAAITKNPSAYNPITKPNGNKNRRNTVISQMYKLEMISKEEYKAALDSELMLDTSQRNEYEISINNYFVDALIDEVIKDLSQKYQCTESTASTMLYNGGYKIYATLNPNVQASMEAVYEDVDKYFSQKAKLKETKGKSVQSAMTVMDYEGNIVGIVGGVGEKKENRGLNRATDSPRQPGSTMKPLGAYTPALEKGIITPSEIMIDAPLDTYYGAGRPGPREWYGYYAGPMSIAAALERSANTIPCKIVKELGYNTSYKFLTEKLHFTHLTERDKNLSSLALGGCQKGITTTQSAAAYAVFGNQGKYYEPTTYSRIELADGTLVLKKENVGNQVIKPATATIMNNMLQNVVYGANGTARTVASYGRMRAYAKTGTSSENNDLWLVAGTPYYVASVWYGFDRQEPIYNSSSAANVWKAVMKDIHKDLEFKSFELNYNLYSKNYCNVTGLLAGAGCTEVSVGKYLPGVTNEVCDSTHTEIKDPYSANYHAQQKAESDAASSQIAEENSSTESSSQDTPSTDSSKENTTEDDEVLETPETDENSPQNPDENEDNQTDAPVLDENPNTEGTSHQ